MAGGLTAAALARARGAPEVVRTLFCFELTAAPS